MAAPRCVKKRRFRDKGEAQRTLHHIQNTDLREVTPVRVYACPWCKGWHLTSKTREGDKQHAAIRGSDNPETNAA